MRLNVMLIDFMVLLRPSAFIGWLEQTRNSPSAAYMCART